MDRAEDEDSQRGGANTGSSWRGPIYRQRQFVGRGDELAKIGDHLVDSRQALAIWGPPGVGKTRLATEVASKLLGTGDFEEALFCPLQAAQGARDIVTILAERVEYPLGRTDVDESLDGLGRWLASKNMLIIFDNAEHVVDDAAEIAVKLSQMSDSSAVLMTTRHRPDEASLTVISLDSLTAADGVTLFQLRTGGGDGDREAITKIVERLDGLPLSIELAARRLPLFGSQGLLERLENQLGTLQDFDEKTQRWEATLEQSLLASWEQLSDDEQLAMKQSTLFRQGFTLADAEEVWGLSEGAATDQVLQGLLQKALIYSQGDGRDGAPRFWLYESVREFAARRQSDGERQELIEQVVAWAARRAKEHVEGFSSADIGQHIAAMRVDYPTLRFALEHAHCGTPKAAAWLAHGMARYMITAAPYHDLRREIRKALDYIKSKAAPGEQARVQVALAQFEMRLGRWDEAENHARKAASIAAENGLQDRLIEATLFLASMALLAKKFRDAKPYLEKAEELLASNGEEPEITSKFAGTWHNEMGIYHLQRREPQAAHDHLRQALVHHRRSTNMRSLSYTYANLGGVECSQGRFAQALGYYERALEQWEQWGAPRQQAMAHTSVGQCLLALGMREQAIASLEEATAIFREIGTSALPLSAAEAAGWLGLTHATTGACGEAITYSDEAIGLLEMVGSTGLRVDIFSQRVAIEYACGHRDLANEYLSRAQAIVDGANNGLGSGTLAIAKALLAAPTEPSTVEGDEVDLLALSAAENEVKPFAAVADRLLKGRWAGQSDSGESPDAAQRLVVAAPMANWFEYDGQRVDISRRDAPRRILTRLVEARLDEPGAVVKKETLVAVGWPEAKLHPEAAASRIYTAIRQLRGLGLEEVLLTGAGGYLLDPQVLLVRDTSATASASERGDS